MTFDLYGKENGFCNFFFGGLDFVTVFVGVQVFSMELIKNRSPLQIYILCILLES